MNFLLLLRLALFIFSATIAAGNLYDDVDITWGDGRAKILDHGNLLTLSLDQVSGSGFQSKKQFLFSKIDIQLKLFSGDSAGTVTTFYLSSEGQAHDEIDVEFLGNVSGEPYTLHTNVFVDGKGNREQQFRLWFDPSKDFHTYSILWTPHRIIFSVDGIPIRDFKNLRRLGVGFPATRPMRLRSSLWNADTWATRGGLVKTDWSKAPFTAYFRNFFAQSAAATVTSMNRKLSAAARRGMSRVRRRYLIYDYCTDWRRFPLGLPPECTRRRSHRG